MNREPNKKDESIYRPTRFLIGIRELFIKVREITFKKEHSRINPNINQKGMGSKLIPRGLCPEVVHLGSYCSSAKL
jgi:hypothetical protein